MVFSQHFGRLGWRLLLLLGASSFVFLFKGLLALILVRREYYVEEYSIVLHSTMTFCPLSHDLELVTRRKIDYFLLSDLY